MEPLGGSGYTGLRFGRESLRTVSKSSAFLMTSILDRDWFFPGRLRGFSAHLNEGFACSSLYTERMPRYDRPIQQVYMRFCFRRVGRFSSSSEHPNFLQSRG